MLYKGVHVSEIIKAVEDQPWREVVGNWFSICDKSKYLWKIFVSWFKTMPSTAKKEVVTSFEHVDKAVHEAFTEEVHLLMHVHLRGYDKEGNGKQMHADYYDKYGAPMKLEESWLEG